MNTTIYPAWGETRPVAYDTVAEVEWAVPCYNFNLTRVFARKADGSLWYAEDSGCSCPSPFESTTVEDLKPITRLQDWHDHVAARMPSGVSDNEWARVNAAARAYAVDQTTAALPRIEAALTAWKARR